jgi:hypothetical protein
MGRSLTAGEKRLLVGVFAFSLPYHRLTVEQNFGNFGGADNSITLVNVPHMAISIWSQDYSDATVPDDDKWTFIHEFGHVWQWCQGASPQADGLWIGVKAFFRRRDYESYYPYDLAESTSFSGYNLEQQASLIADYWNVSRGQRPKYNTGSENSLQDYSPFMREVTSALPSRDWDADAKYANRPDSRPL